jgi:hypothetical protein
VTILQKNNVAPKPVPFLELSPSQIQSYGVILNSSTYTRIFNTRIVDFENRPQKSKKYETTWICSTFHLSSRKIY